MANISRGFRNMSKRAMYALFRVGQGLGFDILPRHFYSEIPDLRRLRGEHSWRRAFSMRGVRGAEVEGQLAVARSVCSAEMAAALKGAEVYKRACETAGEVGYGPAEAEFLYAFVRARKPKRIVQIGCGVSTAICLRAAADANYAPRIICIEPYTSGFLRKMAEEKRIELIARKAQELEAPPTEELGEGDLFFVDSSHTLGPAGEVSRIILEMLPLLGKGAWVHFHDIPFPYDYSPTVLAGDLFFWHECTLLHGFLALNARFKIGVSLAMLHHQRQAELRACLPGYMPGAFQDGVATGAGQYPTAIYLEVDG